MSPSACRSLLYGVEYKSGDTEERERGRKQESRLVDILREWEKERVSRFLLTSFSLLLGPFFLAACRPPSSLRRTNKLAHRELAGFCGSHLDLCTPPSRSLLRSFGIATRFRPSSPRREAYLLSLCAALTADDPLRQAASCPSISL